MAKVKQTNGRLQFDMLDMLRTAMGFDRPDGYAVIPQDIAKQLEVELERLYSIEDEAVGIVEIVAGGSFIAPQGFVRLAELTGRAGIGQ